MAGAGYKLFNTGDVLTAAQVNTYLMEQTVMRFATTTARDTALSGVLAEGMLCYIDADNNIYKYTGSAWVNIDTTGGGSPLTTKGDLYTYSTTDARLPVGNNGETLVADSSTATGLKWAAPGGGGFSTFTDYTPTFTNFTLGNGTVTTQYATSGSLVWYQGRITIGSTSSFSGSLRISLPYQIITTFTDGFYYPMLSVGSGWDSSASTVKVATVRCATGTTLSLTSLDTNTAWTTTQPWTWASDDRINFQVIYRSSEL